MDTEEMENAENQSESTDAFFLGERRPSILRLQGMLKRVSQSPFHRQYKSLTASTSESSDASKNSSLFDQDFSGADVSDSQPQQNGLRSPVNPFLPAAPTEFEDSSTSWNPFTTQIKDSTRSTPKSSENDDLFQSLASSRTFSDVRSTSPPVSSPISTWTASPPAPFSQSTGSQPTTPASHVPDIFEVTPNTWEAALPQSSATDQNFDIFRPLTPIKETTALHSAPFDLNTDHSKERDYLLEYLLTNQKNDASKTTPTEADSFPFTPSSVFQATPPDTPSVFHTPSVTSAESFFQPAAKTPDVSLVTSTSASSDIFQTPSSDVERQVSQSTSLFQTPPSVQPTTSNPFLTNSTPFSATKPTDYNYNVFLTTPGGTQQDILSTPSEPKDESLQMSCTEVDSAKTWDNGGTRAETFKRRPPKPAPRSKPPKPQTDAVITDSPPKPVPPPRPLKVMPKESAFDEEQSLPVYEDVLLIGQEKCVEDWPEDSPEHSPDWKPTGKFKLRRESMRLSAESEGDSGPETLGKKHRKSKIGRKLRVSLLTRRLSKEKFGDELKAGDPGTLGRKSKDKDHDDFKGTDSTTLPRGFKLNDGHTDEDFSSHEDEEHTGVDANKSKKLFQFKGPLGHHRSAKVKSSPEGSEDGSFHSDLTGETRSASQRDGFDEVFSMKGAELFANKENQGEKLPEMKDCRPKSPPVFKPLVPPKPVKDYFLDQKLDDGETKEEDEEENKEEENHETGDHSKKKRKKVKIKFVPQRGYTIGLSRKSTSAYEQKGGHYNSPHPKEFDSFDLKGAYGYTPETKFKDIDTDEIKGAHGYTPSVRSQEFDGLEELKGAHGYTPHPQFGANVLNEFREKHLSSGDVKAADVDEVRGATGYASPPWASEDKLEDQFPQKGADLFKPGDPVDGQHENADDWSSKKSPAFKFPAQRRVSQERLSAEYHQHTKNDHEDHFPQKGADLFKAGDTEDEEPHETDDHPSQRKPNALRSHRRPSEDLFTAESPGATVSSDSLLSEAARAEWRSSQMDMRKATGLDEEERLEGVAEEEEEEEGDTDSLMEWWDTVEFWDELPSDEEIKLQEDETKSFTEIADKVQRGLRVFNKIYTERAEVLYQHVIFLHAIADDLSNFHKRAKIANITGGTTTAVGGVAAIAGLALAPVTFGASLVVSAIGLGVATAGGITAASAAISDNVNNMHDRKKIELILQDYEERLLDVTRCVRFVSEGVRRLRCHRLLRRNNYYTGDWDVRRALQMVSLATEPVERAKELTERDATTIRSLFKGMDRYFTKDSKELKKGCKKEVTAKVRGLANQLHDGLVELNDVRGKLLEASGSV